MSAMREVGLRVLRAGHCRHPEAMTYPGAPWRPAVYPALCALLLHPIEGPVLFDTGYDPAFLEATRPFPERLYRWLTPPSLGPGEAVADQLARLGIQAGEVAHLVLSHFHADHMAGAHRFPNAAIHCARAGHRAACAGRLRALRGGMLPALIPPGFGSRVRWFEDSPRRALPADLAPLEDGADLFGDGSLLAVELPGHCPGHWGLALREAGGLHLLVGDAAWSSRAIRRDAPPPAATLALLGDARASRATLHRLHALWRRNPELRLTPSHCPECAARVEPVP